MLLSLLISLQSSAPLPPVDHVLLISVDGLRSDALLAAGPEVLPNFFQLFENAGTLNARTDPASTLTLPNHTGMMTGHLRDGENGHHWKNNGVPEDGETVHSVAGRYLPSLFDQAHDAGVFTALLAGKEKFLLFDRSWNEIHGALDLTGKDEGRDKIDFYLFETDPEILASQVLSLWGSQKRTLLFFHDMPADPAGHEFGWNLTEGSEYLKAVAQVDARLGRFLDAARSNPALHQNSAIVLTADHGGGAPHHGHYRHEQWVNATIPLLTWRSRGKGFSPIPEHQTSLTAGPLQQDLYGLVFPSRLDPGQSLGLPNRGGNPLRNSDLGILAQIFLGFPVPEPSWSKLLR